MKFLDHHTSHAASAYYGLRKDDSEYLVMTCDGSGDDLCATVRVMGPNLKDHIVAKTQWNDSLGALYSWTTYRMGFVPLEHEYKLMGMAPYCDQKYSDEVKEVFKSFLWLDTSGLRFKRSNLKRISDSSKDIFARLDGKRFDAICGGLQSFTEDLLSTWVVNAARKTGVRKVLGAGGVFMNVKANQIIAEHPEVEYFEAFPSCGDETLPFGAYYQHVAHELGDDQVKPLTHFYFGDSISDDDALGAIRSKGLEYDAPANISQKIAEIIASGFPVARCNGPMEFGARALGNRSILADPSNSDVVRIINQMVKKRDFWMPFAPMMIRESSDDYIVNPKNLSSPYMMMTFRSRDNFKEMIAAVHNADLTCRAQMLERSQNQEMYDIIKEFEGLTGRSVLLNTSFNLHGFPIARTSEDALYIFENSGLEFLQLGKYIVFKDRVKYESKSFQASSMSN